MFDLNTFQKYEAFFAKEHDESFELLHGTGCVMISAPHSVEQTRNGAIKFAEPQTGVLARMLHDSLGCPVIYQTKNCGDDANYDMESPYKQALADYVRQNGIRFVLDLHQLARTRDVQINIGTGRYKNVSDQRQIDAAVAVFETRGIGKILIDTPFAAACPNTVSSYISTACGIPCMQIEMHSLLLWPSSEAARAKDVYDALAELVTKLSQMLREERK